MGLEIDWAKVKSLCEAGCSGTEIADYFGVHYNTLVNRCLVDNGCDFCEFKRQGKSRGDSILRVAQFDKAKNGSDRMQIWLGKNRLGQSDKIETKVDIFTGLSQVRGESVGVQEQIKSFEDEILGDD